MKKRRLLAGLAAAVMAVFSLPISALTAAAATGDKDIRAEFSSASGNPGETVQITLSVPENEGFNLFDLKFKWDNTKVKLTGISPDPTTDDGDETLSGVGFPVFTSTPIWEVDQTTGEIATPRKLANLSQIMFLFGNPMKPDRVFDKTAQSLITFEFEISETAKPGDVISFDIINKTVTRNSSSGEIEEKQAIVTPAKITVTEKVCTHEQLDEKTGTDATCDKPGTKTYYVCRECGKWFEDGTGAKEITDKSSINIPAKGHAYGEPKYDWKTDLSECTAAMVCANDNTHVVTETVKSTSKVTTQPNCQHKGVTTYTAEFKNENFKTQTKTKDEPDVTDHTYDKSKAQYTWDLDNETCVGKNKCTVCGNEITESAKVSKKESNSTAPCQPNSIDYTATFESDAFETKTNSKSEDASAEHVFGNKYASWQPIQGGEGYEYCSFVGYCTVCKETITLATTYDIEKVEKEATCTEDGEVYYVANFGADRPDGVPEKTETRHDKTTATGHKWSGAAYVEDRVNSTCTASVQCLNCKKPHQKIVELVKETHQPYPCKDGYAVYTAVFDDELIPDYTSSKELLPATESHDWSLPVYTWADDYSSCTAYHKCNNDCGEDETAVATKIEAVPGEPAATCTEPGKIKYTARFDTEGFPPEKTQEVDTDPLGHKYGKPTYVINDDNSCTATTVCGNDDSHVVTETKAPDSIETTKPASCSEEGELTYTYNFTNDVLGTYTFTKATEKLPHTEETRIISVEDKPCTEARKATMEDYCIVCGEVTKAAYEDTLEAGKHVFGDAEIDNDTIVASTCTEEGHYDLVQTCTKCGATESKTVTTEPLGHDYFTAEVTVVEATCTEDGTYNVVEFCTRCDYEKILQSGVVKQATGHQPGEPFKDQDSVIPATCTEDGSHDEVVECTVCGEELSRETKTDEKHGHAEGEPVKENEVPATVDAEGRYDEVVYCTNCGAELSRTQKTTEKLQPGQQDPDNTDPDNTDPDNTDPDNTDPDNTDPGNTDPGQQNPGDGNPGGGNVQTGAAASAAGAIALLVAAAAVTVKKKK